MFTLKMQFEFLIGTNILSYSIYVLKFYPKTKQQNQWGCKIAEAVCLFHINSKSIK